MKKAGKVITRILSFAYKIAPLIIGMYCYYPYYATKSDCYYPFLDSLYTTLKLYSGSTDGCIEITALLEIARFLGIATTLSLLIKAFNKLKDVVDRLKLIGSSSVVVYGDSVYADLLYKTLKPFSRIRGENKLIKHAGTYVIMFSTDRQNLEFYIKHRSLLEDKKVYIMLEETMRHNIENSNVKVFSIAENCARQYWKDYPVLNSEKIGIIGFNNVGQNILTYGLMMNIIDPEQHFEYHIYGDGSRYRRLHTELDKMLPDEIFFRGDGNYELYELMEMDRIIICRDENDSIGEVSSLLASLPVCPELYVYSPSGDMVTTLFGKDKVHTFGRAEEIGTADMILNEKATEDARKQHQFYADKYGGDPWERLDSFKRYSNISSADYLTVINRLTQKQVPLRKIAELEHIRWCRYHYLNNWRYGKVRDNSKRYSFLGAERGGN